MLKKTINGKEYNIEPPLNEHREKYLQLLRDWKEKKCDEFDYIKLKTKIVSELAGLSEIQLKKMTTRDTDDIFSEIENMMSPWSKDFLDSLSKLQKSETQTKTEQE